MTEVDVIIAGAGPTGLILAAELRLADVRTLVLERRRHVGSTPKANGFSGQVLGLLRCRGLLEQLEATAGGPIHPASGIPFGGGHIELLPEAQHGLEVLGLPQARLERFLDEHARGLGAQIRYGHELTAATQDDRAVRVTVHGPDGSYEVTARYLVGCDGTRSTVRAAAGIDFRGTTYPEVNRLAEATLHESVAVLDNGDLEVPGLGRLRPGFTRTDRGVFALGALRSGTWLIQTTEDAAGADVDDAAPITQGELQSSIRRLLGEELPLGEVTRLSRYTLQARQADRYRAGRIFVAGDAAHQFPATGIGINVGMTDAINVGWKLAADLNGWAPPGLLDSYHTERHLAGSRTLLQTQAQVALRRGQDPAAQALRNLWQELLRDEQPQRRIAAIIAGADLRYPEASAGDHPLVGTFAPDLLLDAAHGAPDVATLLNRGRPVLLDLANRPDLRAAAEGWADRVDVNTGSVSHRPADALLIRPDARVVWAATIDEPADSAIPALRQALTAWCGKEAEPSGNNE